jgi:hypothetical protein
MPEESDSNLDPADDTQKSQCGSTIGTPLVSDEAEEKRSRVNELMWSDTHTDIQFYKYTDDGETWGVRMEINSYGCHIVPKDIDNIIKNTDWSFVGVQNGAVMFEAEEMTSSEP